MSQQDFLIKKASVEYKSPSNIAFVKYWGKKEDQIPQNASLSMTLSNCFTQTKVNFEHSDCFIIKSLLLDGKSNELFLKKIRKFIDKNFESFKFLNNYSLSIETHNSFPHSSGIASSASGFSALVMCLMEFEAKLNGSQIDLKKASNLSRLGSGSASRSLFNGFAHWGESPLLDSSNLYASEIDYKLNIKDCIAIVSRAQKKTSSSAGHGLMESNPFAEVRYKNAARNLKLMDKALQNLDFFSAGEVIEAEAMELHALMMMSTPSFILLEEESIGIIKLIKEFREESCLPIFFTIDAGPNIHILYLDENKTQVEKFIEDKIKAKTIDLIFDEKGSGPELLESFYE